MSLKGGVLSCQDVVKTYIREKMADGKDAILKDIIVGRQSTATCMQKHTLK